MAIAEIKEVIQSYNLYWGQVVMSTANPACLSNLVVIRDIAIDFYRAAWEEGWEDDRFDPYGFRALRRPHDFPNRPKATKSNRIAGKFAMKNEKRNRRRD